MSIFNEAMIEALLSGRYICSQCGNRMQFEDELNEDILICPICGHSVDLDRYGCEDDEEFERLYPTKEELLGEYEEEDDEECEIYEEECGELEDD